MPYVRLYLVFMHVAAEADTAVETSTPNAENALVTDDDRRNCNARDDNTLLEVRAGVEVDFIIGICYKRKAPNREMSGMRATCCFKRKAPRIEKCLGCALLDAT